MQFCDVPEPDDDEDDELAPQPVTAKAAVSMTAPSTPGLAARPGTLWDRRVNNVSLTDYRPAHVAPAGRAGCLARAVNGPGLAISLRPPESFLFRPPGLSAVHAAARSRSGHAFHTGGQRQPDVEGCPRPAWVSTMISPPWAATSEAAIDKPSPTPLRARVRASSVR